LIFAGALSTMPIAVLFALFILLTLSGVSFISLFFLVAVRQLVLHQRLKRLLPLPFVNPWPVLSAYRALLVEKRLPLGVWRLMHVLLVLTLLGFLAIAALVVAGPSVTPR
jgi:hypothetical protein